jgi:enolase-phosphatase E1
MAEFILMDIEGTTTDIDFVHKTLFPYAAEHLTGYVQTHADDEEVRACLQSVKSTVQAEENREIDDTEAINTLLRWIREDRKHTALKELQGLIWKEGFEQGAYQGHVYPDVPPQLEAWKQQDIGLGIYSSGSVQAQKLLFAHSVAGDLTPYFSHYFDTRVGAKRDPASYRLIAEKLNRTPSSILFLSDVEEELDAAAEAGFQILQLVRGTEPVTSKYPIVHSFADIRQEEASIVC